MTAVFANELRETRPYPLIWQAHRLSLKPLVGPEFTLTRAVAGSASWDTFGVGLSVVRGRPRWVDSGPPTNGVPKAALHLGAAAGSINEYLSVACPLPTVELSGLVEFVEKGTVATGDAGSAGATVFAIGNAAGTGARLVIYAASNGQYTAEYHNGTSPSTSQQSGALVTDGQRVRLRWSLTWSSSNLLVQLWQSINEGAEVAATAGTPVSGVSWGTNPFYWLNRWSTVQDAGHMLLRNLVVSRGVQTQAKLLEALAP